MKYKSRGFGIVALVASVAIAFAVGAFALTHRAADNAPTAGSTCTGTNFGGTGVCYPTTVSYGNVLVGNSAGGYTLTATSSLGISGGGSQNIASVLAQGNDAAGLALADVGLLTVKSLQATSSTQSNIANLGGMLDASLFAGSDIGVQMNTAYTNSSSIGAHINVPNPTSGSTWQFATGINANTANKPLLITCNFGGSSANYGTSGATLRYTGTTGTSTTFNTNSYIIGGVSGLEHCNLQGTNGTTARITDGVYFGGNNGAFSAYIDHSDVSGFGTGVVLRPNTSFNSIINSNVHFNGRNISEPDTSGANCENSRILNSTIADANNQVSGVTDLNGMYVQESGNCQWNIGFTSFDDNQIKADQFGGTANIWNVSNSHFENPNLHVYPMFATNIQSGAQPIVYNSIGSDYMNDTVAGQPSVFEGVGTYNFLGTTIDSNNNVTGPVTRVVNATASTTEIRWIGSTVRGVTPTYLYGNFPVGPIVVGTDYGAPTFYVSSTTATNGGNVGIGTSSPSALFGQAILNLGKNSNGGFGTSASTTVRYTGIGQMEMKNTAGATVCMFVVGTTPTVSSGSCNN